MITNRRTAGDPPSGPEHHGVAGGRHALGGSCPELLVHCGLQPKPINSESAHHRTDFVPGLLATDPIE